MRYLRWLNCKGCPIGGRDHGHLLLDPSPLDTTLTATPMGWLRFCDLPDAGACRHALITIEKDRNPMTSRFRLLAVAAGIALTFTTSGALAGPKDYVFEPVAVDARQGSGSELAVRITHRPTGKPVEGVVLFRTRLDGSPHNMGSMTAKHTAMPSTEPGVYKFRADFEMAGNWAFKLMAKIPGETETVQGTVIFKVK